MRKLKSKLCLCLIMVLAFTSAALTSCKQVPTGSQKANNPNEKTVTLKWYIPGRAQPDQQIIQDEFNKRLKEKINTTVDFNIIDFGTYDDRMNMVIAANEFDMCFTSANWINKYYSAVSKGAFLPLNDLIDKYLVNTKKKLPDYLFEEVKVKGQIYALPNYQICYKTNSFIIPKSLADKYKLDIDSLPLRKGLETYKAMEPFLETIKKNEPGLYPFRADYNSNPIPYLFAYETIGASPIAVRRDDTSLKAVDIHDTLEYKQNDELLRDWFKKGYIRPDLVSVMNDFADQDNDKYAVRESNSKPGGIAELEQKFGHPYIEIPINSPVVGPDTGMAAMTAISKNCAHPDKAMQVLELVNSDVDLFNLLCFGIEGKHYQKVSENQINIPKDSQYNPNSAWVFGNQFNCYYIQGQQPGIWEETHNINMTAQRSNLMGFNLDNEPIKSELAQIDAVEKEYRNIWLFPEYEKLFNERKEKLNHAGIQKVTAEIQKQIDNWVKNK